METLKKEETVEELKLKVDKLKRQLDECLESEETILMRIGSIKSSEDILTFMRGVSISTDHLLILNEMMNVFMWREIGIGEPHQERERIIKDIQYDIRYMYECVAASKILYKREKIS